MHSIMALLIDHHEKGDGGGPSDYMMRQFAKKKWN
jgi:hypothetical protein